MSLEEDARPLEEAREARRPKNPTGPLLILLILLFDVGLGVWGWNVYQAKKSSARYGTASIDLTSAPVAIAALSAGAPAAARALLPNGSRGPELSDPSASFPARPSTAGTSSPSGVRQPSASAFAAAASQKADSAGRASPRTRQSVGLAAREFYRLKNDSRFRESATIRNWTRDFLSYPDLKAVNERYRSDRDPVRFLVSMFRSDNFKALLDKNFSAPDIQEFVRSMSASPTVIVAAQGFFADFNIPAAVRRLPLPTQTVAAQPAPPPADGAQALDRVRNNPAIRKHLNAQGDASAVRLKD